ncbi:hypothetical protein UO65_0098 [Actinokineospora spheciospongiae]|uniref:TrbC/VIRB2 family protein n=1 Tax=Actinokineospora spheciospongiae TaxID=909613 RepID=W7J643_9PSEU|nr:pilin [Actinokineospora spheciospongiae]EWC64491.1 hypothetical protein UO65_0098 [Actinokineospora spheciospongiae]
MRLTHSPTHHRPDRRAHSHLLHRGHANASRTAARRTDPRTAEPNTIPATSTVSASRSGSALRAIAVLTGVAVLVPVLCASTAHADTTVLALAGSVEEVLNNIRNWLMGILATLATVFLTIGGVRRVFGGGDPGEQEKSKEAFKAAGIGYALAALAPLVVTVLKGIVGA